MEIIATREERSRWIKSLLDRQGLAEYGRASAIKKRLGCSHAQATGWLKGQLPKDLGLAVRFAVEFLTTCEEWVTTVPRSDIPADYQASIEKAVLQSKKFEEEKGRLSPETFLTVFHMIQKHNEGKLTLEDNMAFWESAMGFGKKDAC